jgi:hypothetical protein
MISRNINQPLHGSESVKLFLEPEVHNRVYKTSPLGCNLNQFGWVHTFTICFPTVRQSIPEFLKWSLASGFSNRNVVLIPPPHIVCISHPPQSSLFKLRGSSLCTTSTYDYLKYYLHFYCYRRPKSEVGSLHLGQEFDYLSPRIEEASYTVMTAGSELLQELLGSRQLWFSTKKTLRFWPNEDGQGH